MTTPRLSTPHIGETSIYGGDSDDDDDEKANKDPSIDVHDIKDDAIKFVLDNCDLSVANSLRRVCIGEVPTMAIDFADISENSCVLQDEFLAHRLGLIPLVSDKVEKFEVARECTCDNYCEFCAVEFSIDVHNKGDEIRSVWSTDLQNITKADDELDDDKVRRQKAICRSVEPVDAKQQQDALESEPDPILIVKLGPGQRIKAHCIARKGIGKEHAKFQCVSALGFHPELDIKIDSEEMAQMTDEQKTEFAAACPAAFELSPQSRDIVIKPQAGYCKPAMVHECSKLAMEYELPGLLKVGNKPRRWIFNIETVGQMPPALIFTMAIDILKGKLEELRKGITNLQH